MSYDIPSISELEAIQLLNKHYAEVVTSKKDGIASGSDITQTTNPITGVVRRTLYKILDDMDDTFLERLLKMAFTPVGTFTAGATLTDARQTLLWEVSQGGDGHYYSWSGSFGTSGKVVAAGSSPSEPEWVDRTDDSLRDEIRETVFQNMKRLAAEAGFNLVDGSFEEGGTLTNTNDVLWYQSNGRYYSWNGAFPKVVAPGTNPTLPGSGYVSRTDVALRGDVASYIIPEQFGFVGDLTASGDLSATFTDMLNYATSIGVRNIHFSKRTKFNLNTRIENMGGIVISGNAEILTTHADNRYLKCAKNETGIPDNLSSVGDVSAFANAILDKRYTGAPLKVVIVGDSIMMGGYNYRDYSWPARRVQDAIQKAVDVPCEFYNRAIAGSAINELLGTIPAYADPATAHAPGEPVWITDTGRTWLSYINDIKPDMVVIGFGMNAMNADDLKYAVQVRAALKAISNPSIVWVTTPMRTTDPSKSLGTWPHNEYSNAAGIGYGKYAQFVGDSVIDVNAASNVVMNGMDVRSGAMNIEPVSRYVATNATVTEGEALGVVFASGGEIRSMEYSRDCAVEFVVGAISNTLRVILRQDPLSVASIYADITPAGITLLAPHTSTGKMNVVGTYTGSTINKRVRVQANGSSVFVAVENINQIEGETFGANFSNRAAIFTTSGTAEISDLRFLSATYKSNVKLLSTDEIFAPKYGVGGNYLNHPNPNGVEYLYSKPIADFELKLFSALSKNNSVKAEAYPELEAPLLAHDSSIVARRNGDVISVIGTKLQGDIAPGTRICTLDAKFWPAEQLVVPMVLISTTYKASAVVIATDGAVTVMSQMLATDGQYGICATYARIN